MQNSRTLKISAAGLFAALAFFTWALCQDIGAPWVMNDSYTGAFYSQAAHNFFRAGLVKTAAVPAALYFGPLPIPRESFYVHHPTLFPLAVTGAFAVFGESEWVARAVPVICSLISVVLLWLLVKSCAGPRAAAFSVAAFITMPMELHYGQLVDFEPMVVMWMLAALTAMRQWQTTGRWMWRALMLLAFALAVWTDWPGVLFTSIVAAFLFFGKKERGDRRRTALTLGGLVFMGLAWFAWQIHMANPSALQDLGRALQMRLGSGNLRGGTFTISEWARTVAGYLWTFYLPIHWLLGIAGIVCISMRQARSEGMRWLSWAALCIFLAGLGYVVGLRNESYVHDYAFFYFTAPIAIACGIALDSFVEWFSRTLEQRVVRTAGFAAIALLLAGAAVWGYTRSAHVDSQFDILDIGEREPFELMPTLGRTIGQTFTPETKVLCNFDPYYSPLAYYAQRTLLNGTMTADEWRAAMAEDSPVAGVVWRDAPGAAEILANLPASEQKPVEVCGIRFVFWAPKSSLVRAD